MKEGGELKDLLQVEREYAVAKPKISPDGRWLAYVSDESGQRQIDVSSFPDVKGKCKISKDGGDSPLWSPDGRELFYRNDNKFMAVSVEADTAFNPGKPELLFEEEYVSAFRDMNSFSWDIHPDGKRFLMIKPVEMKDDESPSEVSPKIIIVTNWFEELKERVPRD